MWCKRVHWGEWVSEAASAPAPAAVCATRTQHATVSGCLSCTYRRETNLARTSYDTTTNADTTRDKPFNLFLIRTPVLP